MRSLHTVSINQTHSLQEKIAVQNVQGHGEKHLYQHSVSSCWSFQLLPGAACLCFKIGNEQRNGQKDGDHEQNILVEPLRQLVLLPSRV